MKSNTIIPYKGIKQATPADNTKLTDNNGNSVWARGIWLDNASTAGYINIRCRGNAEDEESGSGGTVKISMAVGDERIVFFDCIHSSGTDAVGVWYGW